MNFGHGFDSRQVHLSTVLTDTNVETLMLQFHREAKETERNVGNNI